MDLKRSTPLEAQQTAEQRVAIFGGGFNPPHLAHVFTITYLLSRADVDEVWLLPAVRHAFDKQLTPLEDRVRLLERSLRLGDQVKLCLIESEPQMSGRTYDTLSELSARHPATTFTLVIGADNLTESHRWHRFDELCARWSLIVLGRPGHEDALREMSVHAWCLPGPTLMSVSSTEIREALRDPSTLDWLSAPLMWLPERARALATQLYRDSTGSDQGSGQVSDQTSEVTFQTELQIKDVVTIWGSGRCGRSLAQGLKRSGAGVQLVSLRSLATDDERAQPRLWPDVIAEALGSSVWILTCRDDDLELWSTRLASELNLARDRSDQRFKSDHFITPRALLHCSGARSHEALRVMRASGLEIGRMHPLMSLRGDGDRLRGATCLVAGDPTARHEALTLVELLGAYAISEPPELQELSPRERLALYHCAAALGANLASVPLALGELIFQRLGYQRAEASRALRALYEAALSPHLSQKVDTESTLTEQWATALTGPVARGDHDTICAHLEALSALSQIPEKDATLDTIFNLTPELYRVLSLMAAHLAHRPELAERLKSATAATDVDP